MVREREHISMERENPDGNKTPMTICTQAGISRDEFIKAYKKT
jgi:hypothetical protein